MFQHETSLTQKPELHTAYRAHVATLEQAYSKALAEAQLDAVLIHSGTPKSRTDFDDQYWPLRVTPHFQHWLPLAEPGCALIIRAGARPKLLWLREGSFWEQPPPVPGSFWQSSFDIVEIQNSRALAEHLPRGRVAFIGEDRDAAIRLEIEERQNPTRFLAALDNLRVTKTTYELLCLDEANRIAGMGHAAVRDAFADDSLSELDLHLLYLRATRQDDPETPYKNIVALCQHAATLHHISYAKEPVRTPDRTLLLDAGATCLGYASDVTRTYVRGASGATRKFAAMLAAMERMQQQLCVEAKVGMKYERLHDRAHEEVARILVDAGVCKTSTEQAVSDGVTRAFFPHGLGHSLGLQCHDVGCAMLRPRPDNPFLRNTTTISPGQVFTIEPGIYFIDSLLNPLRKNAALAIDWSLVDELAPLGGIRIEDDVHVEASGPVRNFTRAYL